MIGTYYASRESEGVEQCSGCEDTAIGIRERILVIIVLRREGFSLVDKSYLHVKMDSPPQFSMPLARSILVHGYASQQFSPRWKQETCTCQLATAHPLNLLLGDSSIEQRRCSKYLSSLAERLKHPSLQFYICLLFVFVPIGFPMRYTGQHAAVIFTINLIAILPSSSLLDYGLEQVGLRYGDLVQALLYITFGYSAIEPFHLFVRKTY
jgi:hypothetical protein